METKVKQQEIVKLSPITISRIAAGEVVERPASVIKELIENSLDAGSSEIIIKIEDAGKGLISVSDNGCGMDSKNLALAVKSHTTSKLKGDDLINIESLGFRGEAIASIGAISRLTILSRPSHLIDGARITIIGGEEIEVAPAPHHIGTTVEIRDLFYATPARLKFLKANKTENQHIENIINKIAVVNPKVVFKFYVDGKLILNYSNIDLVDSIAVRISEVLGKEFFKNSIPIEQSNESAKLSGYVCLPTYARFTYTEHYLYINNRPVRDKLLLFYIKNAYQDFIGSDKYPMTVLFLDIPKELVDVNVHPAKTEVRFRDLFFIKNLVVGTLRRALEENSTRTSSTIGTAALNLMEERIPFKHFDTTTTVPQFQSFASHERNPPTQLCESIHSFNAPKQPKGEGQLICDLSRFGIPKAQLHNTYIVSQTEDGVIIVDQHAAHERIGYEKLKKQIASGNIESQQLLVPEVIELDNLDIQDKLLKMKDDLLKSGLKIEYQTKKIIKVTEVPSLLKGCNIKELMAKIINNILDLEDDTNVELFINKVLATYACHYSIRAGRGMLPDEMQKLLREMEETKSIGQCNHGRPTYIELKLKDIKKLFERS
jgi:DNA mismatch repair protein MutL